VLTLEVLVHNYVYRCVDSAYVVVVVVGGGGGGGVVVVYLYFR